MTATINTNINSLTAQRNLTTSQSSLSTSSMHERTRRALRPASASPTTTIITGLSPRATGLPVRSAA